LQLFVPHALGTLNLGSGNRVGREEGGLWCEAIETPRDRSIRLQAFVVEPKRGNCDASESLAPQGLRMPASQ
jgi:hypothetical protein